MFERPHGGERAILVQLSLPEFDAASALEEFEALAVSADASIEGVIRGARMTPEPKYYVGQGKAEEIREAVLLKNAQVVLINHELSPSQERNLERFLSCRVVDRTGLILDIFARRARTFEGKLQVELAQLQHLSTRLVRGWTHLERQKGGIGLRGPGETQLETDRRLLRARIKSIHNRLEKVRKSRDQSRQARRRAALPTVALVGYTNAGKTTLFNVLTGAHVYAADQLFATLDPTMRKLELPGAPAVILADTVGFIRALPHSLVNAFHATLEETKEADLLLQVIDVTDPDWRAQVTAVEHVLKEIGADKTNQIQVFNKIDKQASWKPKVSYLKHRTKVWLSAMNTTGLDLLREAIAEKLYGPVIEEEIILSEQQARARAQLYQAEAVVEEIPLPEGGWRLQIRLHSNIKDAILG